MPSERYGILRVSIKNVCKKIINTGDYTSTVEISLPTSGCGVRSENLIDGSYEYSVRLIIQMDEKLRQSSDLQRIVRCKISEDVMAMNIPMVTGTKRKHFRFSFSLFFHLIFSHNTNIVRVRKFVYYK